MRTECCRCRCRYFVLLYCCCCCSHRVPDGNYCWFIGSDSSAFFLFKHELFFNVPLGSTVAFTASILPTSSVIMGMRGAKAAVTRRGEAPLVPW